MGDDGAHSDGTSSSESDGADETGETDEGEVEPDLPGPTQLARGGLLVEAVTINQGIEIPIGLAGEGVGPADRLGFVAQHRPGLIRGYWVAPPDDWEPREILGRLELSLPDEEPVVLEDTVLIDGPAAIEDLERTFTWELDPELIAPFIEYRVELWETDPDLVDGAEPEVVPALPLEGSYPVGVEMSPQELKMVVVPVRHQIGGCDNELDVTQSELEVYARALEQLYPVEFADVTAREEFIYTDSIGSEPSYSKLLTALSQLRTADDPAPNVFYYGVVISCDGGPGGTAGMAYSIPPPTKAAAFQRVAVGNFIGGADTSKIIMVHELGHSLGRKHVYCAGENNPDPDYPHPGGGTEVWGYGIHDQMLYDPAERSSYMSYCFTYWVSDYGWNLTFGLIQTFTGWDYEDSEPQGDVLVGALYPDGERDWWVTPGGVDLTMGTSDGFIELDTGGSSVLAPALVSARPDSGTLNVFVPLPEGWTRGESMTWTRSGGEREAVRPKLVLAR